ncbi:phage major capsid protein [Achromobacter sp. UBA4530]|uniref:phage major capsid protein n=1 Tax=Achromobacter sp. UBA4530 TaxID=1945912 RepID=UPI00257A0FA6|nr:phage major capsid protein [Achromobacter sp. UBA4530]
MHAKLHTKEYGRKDSGRDQQQQAEADLAALTREFKAKTDEVKELGRQILSQKEAGEQSTTELKGKVDEALQKQGELGQQMRDLEQAISQGLKSMGRGEDETLGSAIDKFLEENPDAKDLLVNPVRGKSVLIPMSRKALLSGSPTGGALIYPGEARPMVAPLVQRLTVRGLLMPGRTSKPVVFYPRETGYTGGPEPVSEGTLKPEFNLEVEMVTETVKTIAHWTDISLQMLDDVDYIRSYIEGRMLYQLALVEENQLLNGSGVGNNLHGLYTTATAYSRPAGVSVQNEQQIDRLRLMMLQVELADAFATGIVLHPTDWATIELLKDGQRGYLFTNPQMTTTGRLWGRDVVSTKSMSQGDALTGDFAAHAQILDRQDANVAISFENKDNFVKNMATIRVEERLVLANYRPEAFVKGPIDNVS